MPVVDQRGKEVGVRVGVRPNRHATPPAAAHLPLVNVGKAGRDDTDDDDEGDEPED